MTPPMTDTATPRPVSTPSGAVREARLKEAAAALLGIIRDEECARERLLTLDAALGRRAELRPVPSTRNGSD
jgi:hypothetical protein